MKGWKTYIFGVLTIVLGILQSAEVTTLISEHPGSATTIIGIVIVILRAVTTSPIFNPKPSVPPTHQP